jgi:hypothetical protein
LRLQEEVGKKLRNHTTWPTGPAENRNLNSMVDFFL